MARHRRMCDPLKLYCITFVSYTFRFPIIRLWPRGSNNRCDASHRLNMKLVFAVDSLHKWNGILYMDLRRSMGGEEFNYLVRSMSGKILTTHWRKTLDFLYTTYGAEKLIISLYEKWSENSYFMLPMEQNNSYFPYTK